MKFTIVTPTHIKNSYLLDLYTTIKTQTYENWEWVLYLNGGATVNLVEQEIRNDPRVKIFIDDSGNNCVGYVKNKAFHLGDGDIIVEVDHDDLISMDCLEELYKVFQDNSIGFAYSDDALYKDNDSVQPFGSVYGWTYRKIQVGDALESQSMELIAHHSFPPTSHSLSFIWYAPDHVRAWRRSVYESIGGHNPDLSICDDHELMIRTYLSTKMMHIPKVLYIYRITGNNTWLERNQQIQLKTKELFEKYAWELACKDAKDNGLHIVDLGGGINPKEGCDVNIDIEGGTLQANLNDGIPLPDNSVGVINASHILEHLHDKHKIMCEIYRVLADGGWAFIQIPSTDGRGAFQDPTHVSYWNENCFWYYTRKDKAKYIRNTDVRFQEFKLNTFWWEPREHNIAITDAWLVAMKSDKRRPHYRDI